jgi:hypothetical protein
MSRWFRIYDDLVHDRKVQDLAGPLFKGWINILCLASKNDGVLPSIGDVAFALRLPIPKASQLIEALTSAGLIDQLANGQLSPHNWDNRQHKSDSSTERVKAYRERQRNVSLQQDGTVTKRFQ